MDAAVARLVLTDAFVRVNFVLGSEFLYRYTLVTLVPTLKLFHHLLLTRLLLWAFHTVIRTRPGG
jgi:hypothetical protein